MAAGPSLDDRDPRGSRRGSGAAKRLARPAGRGGGHGDRPAWMRYLLLAIKLGMLGAFACIAYVVFLFARYGNELPDLNRLDDYRPKQVTRILDRNNVPVGELGSEKRTVV